VNELPPLYAPQEEFNRKVQTAVNQLIKGNGNNAQQSLTLTAGTVTTVADQRATTTSLPQLIPLNSAAASITWHISARRTGEFDITHSAAAGTESFGYTLHGG
jgi:hypothetical protein